MNLIGSIYYNLGNIIFMHRSPNPIHMMTRKYPQTLSQRRKSTKGHHAKSRKILSRKVAKELKNKNAKKCKNKL